MQTYQPGTSKEKMHHPRKFAKANSRKKELNNGYAYKFSLAVSMVNELTEFVKMERACCGFFGFDLSISGDKKEV